MLKMNNRMENNIMNDESLASAGGYAALVGEGLTADFSEDLTGLTLRYDRIRIPSAASPVFEIPGGDGESETVKELSCVIILQHPMNSFYREPYTGGQNPPDCGSFDGMTGSSGQGCADCPLNRFGSGEGVAKRCKNKRLLYLLFEGELLPQLLVLPTGSLREFTNYLKRNLSRGRRLNGIVTRISLQKATNAGGIVYSQCMFHFERVLSPAEQAAIAPIINQAKTYAANLTLAQWEQIGDDMPVTNPETGEVVEPLV